MFDQNTQGAVLNEAIAAAKSGDRVKAKDKLTRYLRYDQKNELAWLWMSAVVESDRERIFCLTNALKLNPNNKTVKRGLALLGALPPEMKADLDIDVIGVDLKADSPRTGTAAKPQRPGFTFRRNRRLENLGILLLAVIIIGGFVTIAFSFNARLAVADLLGIDTPTFTPTPVPPTPTPTPTETPAPPTPTKFAPATPIAGINQTPIAVLLGLPEFTPTPEPFDIPNFPEESFGRGLRFYNEGNYDTALREFETALDLNGENYVAHYYIGLIHLQRKAYNQAFNAFGQAIRFNANFAPAYIGRGQATFGLGGNPLTDYGKARDAAPNWVEPFVRSAEFYLSRRNPAAALAELQTARQLAPANVVVQWNLAEVYLALGQMDEARAALATAFEIDATALDLYRLQAALSLVEADYPTALENSNIYISYVPTDPAGWTLQGKAYHGLGQYEQALAALNRAIELDPFDPRDALITRGAVHLRLNSPDLAKADFDRARSLGVTTRNHLLIGQAYYQVGDFANAVVHFQRAVDSDITQFDTHYWLGAALVGDGQFEAGLASLEEALSKADTDLRRFDAFFMRGKAFAGLDQRPEAVQAMRDALALNVAGREAEREEAELILSRFGGPDVNATQTPTAAP